MEHPGEAMNGAIERYGGAAKAPVQAGMMGSNVKVRNPP